MNQVSPLFDPENQIRVVVSIIWGLFNYLFKQLLHSYLLSKSKIV